MQTGERLAITTIGLDAIPSLAWNERGGDDHTVMTDMSELTSDPITAGTGLVTKG